MSEESAEVGESPPSASSGEARTATLSAPMNALRTLRATAHEIAARKLAELGFVGQTVPDHHWVGSLGLPRSGARIEVTVRLPPEFPDALPKIFARQEFLPNRVAHIEADGKVCLAPTNNVLLDGDRPADLIAETLRRATDVIDRGLLGETDADLDAEFEAYWAPTSHARVLSLCNSEGQARSIAVCHLTGGSALIDKSRMLADDVKDVEAWAKHVGAHVGSFRPGLFIPVDSSLPLAASGQETTVSEIAQLVARHATSEGQKRFHEAIERADYPQVIVFSMPEAPAGAGRRMVAIRITRPDASLLKEASRGFRPGRVPAVRVLRRIGREPVERLNLRRVDRAFLVARGGAAARLADAKVCVIGVGAVGSEIARNLAAIGVGHIHLVDPDELNPENVHRHALGMSSTGYKKAGAMTLELRRSFPHLNIDGRDVRVEVLIEADPAFLLDADVIVLATGEETLERRLNRLLQDGPPRVHTWLEPLGIAGHAFACGRMPSAGNASHPARGCFECLYLPDEERGLVNLTALTAAGQDIRRSLAGCAGTFSPFSPLDARRTAADATELVSRVLAGTAPSPVLVSWRGLHTEFEAAGYRLSSRGSQMAPGARIEVSGSALARDGCLVCGVRARTTAMIQDGATKTP